MASHSAEINEVMCDKRNVLLIPGHEIKDAHDYLGVLSKPSVNTKRVLGGVFTRLYLEDSSLLKIFV